MCNDDSLHFDKIALTGALKSKAFELGFSACGVAKAGPVDAATANHIRRWLAEGGNAGMDYMSNNLDKRLDPRLLMTDVKSIVSFALNYTPGKTMPEGEFQFAAYALGKDYHDIMKEKLRELAGAFDFQDELHAASEGGRRCRIFVDSAPVLERYWAQRAGIGWIGHNHQLIVPGAGSMFFLGELFVNVELEYDEPVKDRCGSCHRCVDACPTGALEQGKEIDASKCLSYQLIENRDELSEDAKEKMGDTIYGCDRCQKACPWNRLAKPNTIPELQPKEELLSMTKTKWEHLTVEEYRRLFKGSAVKRVKYDGLMRNIRGAEENDK